MAAQIRLKGFANERTNCQTLSSKGLTVLKNNSDVPLQIMLYKKQKGRFPASDSVKKLLLKKGEDELVIAHINYRKIVVIAP